MTVERIRNAGGSLAWKSLLLLTLGAAGLMAQFPPEVQADRYTVQAQLALEEQDYAGARVALEKILELKAQHDLLVPAEFYFQYADVLQRTGAAAVALENVRHYLERVGREGQSYMAALKLMARLEREIAELEKAERERAARAERERAARAERERAARAERERVARAAAERRNAAKKLSEEMEFVRIPAGTFQMGSKSKHADSDERPQMQVQISREFEIGKYEVTQSEWSAVMGLNPSTQVCARCPVTDVSWHDVQNFIRILNEASGKVGLYRLPTEAEWEYAARAGSRTDTYAGDLRKSWGKDPVLEGIAWHSANSGPHPVGGKRTNAWGLHDMLGNVSEWVGDWYGPYPGGTVTNPTGPGSGSNRVARGGGWIDDARYCRAATRYRYEPGHRYLDLGFRLVRTML